METVKEAFWTGFVFTKGQEQRGKSIKIQPAVKDGAVMKVFSVVVFCPIGQIYLRGKPLKGDL